MYEYNNGSFIYDFETLSQDPFNGVVVSLAVLNFDERRFAEDPYGYDELIGSADFIKFNVEEQVRKYGRKIQQSTLDWWKEQGDEAKNKLKPSPNDVSISELYDYFHDDIMIQNCWMVYTRNNTFDPIFLQSIFYTFGKKDPTPWWNIRDIKSLIQGFTYGHTIKDSFIPDVPAGLEKKFVKHDPVHDVAMDVMRFQYLVRLTLGLDEVPESML